MKSNNTAEYLLSLSRYVDDAEFVKSILPQMRKDVSLLKNYEFRPGCRMRCAITAFAAKQDDMAYVNEIQQWDGYTSGTFRLIEVDGDHWFLNRNRKRILDALTEISAVERLKGANSGSALQSFVTGL